MTAIDYLKALGVAVLVMVFTLAASFPMVAFYATFIEPGHPQQFYNDAAMWIAPWSSHVLGPLAFLAFNYRLAKRSPRRNAMAFAVMTFVFYLLVDFSTLPLMGIDILSALTLTTILSLLTKLFGALGGARLGTTARTQAI
ncbi:MAG: hypothetical protein Q8L20_16785 [Gammaproteobacteria bacterium]|nr:hypothetical protein [Gammaproteobacteria bacterium]